MNRFFCHLILITGAACCALPLHADEPALSADEHSHAPIFVRSRPVVDRLPLEVIRPVDVVINSLGETLVADSGGGILFRVNRRGDTSVLGRDLKGIERVVDHPELGVHVLLSDSQSGQVLRITDQRFQMRMAYLPFQPIGLAVDLDGNLYTSNRSTGEIIRMEDKDRYRILGRVSEPVQDLTVDKMGTVYVLLQSGRIDSLGADGEPIESGTVPMSATRLAWHLDGFMVALAEDSEGRPTLFTSGSTVETSDRFAGTPRGTNAFAFDRLGNLTLSNPNLRAVTRVTSTFEIQCQHCNQPALMVLDPDAPLPEFKSRRSF